MGPRLGCENAEPSFLPGVCEFRGVTLPTSVGHGAVRTCTKVVTLPTGVGAVRTCKKVVTLPTGVGAVRKHTPAMPGEYYSVGRRGAA